VTIPSSSFTRTDPPNLLSHPALLTALLSLLECARRLSDPSSPPDPAFDGKPIVSLSPPQFARNDDEEKFAFPTLRSLSPGARIRFRVTSHYKAEILVSNATGARCLVNPSFYSLTREGTNSMLVKAVHMLFSNLMNLGPTQEHLPLWWPFFPFLRLLSLQAWG